VNRLALTALSASLPLALAAGCAGPARNFAAAPNNKQGCEQLQAWAAEKYAALPAQAGETGAEEDAREAAACWHRNGDDARGRAALLFELEQEVAARGKDTSARAGTFDDALARTLAAVALSSHARGDAGKATEERATKALAKVSPRTLELDTGHRNTVGSAGSAVSMIDGDCFFCAKAEVYGAQDREHVEQLGRWAGLPFVRRDDGREQFLLNTRLVEEGQQSPQQLFADAMRRRGRRISDGTSALLATRAPSPGEESSLEAPLFRMTLRGIAVGDVQREAADRGGLFVPVRSDAGDAWVKLPMKLLQRAARDRRFVSPPDGVDVVVRYEGKEQDRPLYRAIILRTEDGAAEGP
jgi:hypothetical protein